VTVSLHLGDCLDVLRDMPDNSVDSIVTDPPYELGFMGKRWDATGIAYDVNVWRECLRILKPGGHLLAFGGTRTYHRLACAVEDAGFEIRDQIMWIYGSGFPKSLAVDKAIDKAAGAEREVIRRVPKLQSYGYDGNRCYGGDIDRAGQMAITAPATPDAETWQGWGTALKPAHEPIVLARKPLIGTVAANVLEWGCGALNVDASRIKTAEQELDARASERLSSLCSALDRGGVALSSCLDALEHIVSVLRSCSTDDTALEHSVGGRDGKWPEAVGYAGTLLDRLLPSVDLCALSWSSIPSSRGDCLPCRRLCDALLLRMQGAAQESAPSLLDALAGTCLHLREWTHSHESQCIGHPSSSDVARLVSACLRLLCGSVQEHYSTSLASRQPYAPNHANRVYGVGMGEGVSNGALGRFPANLIHDGSDEVVGLFPNTKAGTAIRHASGGNTFGGDRPKPPLDDMGYGDSGSAARFFKSCPLDDEDIEAQRLVYCAKASRRDRDEGLEGMAEVACGQMYDDAYQWRDDVPNGCSTKKPVRRNFHPCVKPTALMRYLCRLVTPPGGVVLDPFMGSGSTGKAAVLEGFGFVGIEKEAEYMAIAERRIEYARRQPALVEAAQ